MQSFGHQKNSPGNVPRKIASLLTSDRFTDQPLNWASSIVRTRGMSPGVLHRVLCASPVLESMTLHILNSETYESGSGFADSGHAIANLGFDLVWRAAQLSCYSSLVSAAVRTPSLSSVFLSATAVATAETAAWIAERHIVDPNESFSLALWSEVGLIGGMYVFPDAYAAMYEHAENRTIESLEKEAFGFDHQTVGSCIMRLFKFPSMYVAQCARHEIELLELNLEEKLIRAAVVSVASIGGWWHPKNSRPNLSASVLAGALLRDSDKEDLQNFARTSLGNAMRYLTLQRKKTV